MRQLSDGASKVYLIGEKYVSQMSALTTGDSNADMGSIYHGMDEALIRMGSSGGVYVPQNGGIGVLSQPQSGTSIQAQFQQYLYPPFQDAAVWAAPQSGGSNQAPKNVPVDCYEGLRFGSAACRRFQHGLLRRLGPFDQL